MQTNNPLRLMITDLGGAPSDFLDACSTHSRAKYIKADFGFTPCVAGPAGPIPFTQGMRDARALDEAALKTSPLIPATDSTLDPDLFIDLFYEILAAQNSLVPPILNRSRSVPFRHKPQIRTSRFRHRPLSSPKRPPY
jgi:hypothetical protein